MNTQETTIPTPNADQGGLLLPGLDGSNPLGFLAALGVLRVLSKESPIQMKWTPSGGTWVPVIRRSDERVLDEETILNVLLKGLCNCIEDHPANLLNELKESEEKTERRDIFIKQAMDSTISNRVLVDWLAALASEVAPADAVNQLQTTRRDYFYGNLKSVLKKTQSEHLRRSIFCNWDYADPLDNQSLHLDPSEDRRHAHQWNRPAGDPSRKKQGGMLGANRLAIEAIPLFSSVSNGEKLHTTGFTGNRSTDTYWTWPLWGDYLFIPIVRSLLLLQQLQKNEIDQRTTTRLGEMGIVAVFRTQRILVGKTPNFTPARCIVSMK